MANDLNILVKTKIDNSSSQIRSIESQIKQLSAQIKQALSIKLQIDTSGMNVVAEQTKQRVKTIQAEINKTPMQIRIDAATGVSNGTGSVTKEYKQMYAGLLKEQDAFQSALVASQANNRKRQLTDEKAQAKAINAVMDKKYKDTLTAEREIYELKRNMQIKLNALENNSLRKYTDKSAVAKIKNDLASLNKDMPNYKQGISDVNYQFKKLSSEADTASRNSLKFGESLKTAWVKGSVWMIGLGSMYAVIHSIQDGIQYITEIDTALTNLNKVTDETKETLINFSKEANKIGYGLARTTSEVINSTTEFARLGYKLNEAKILAQKAMLYSNVGDIDEITASQDLISAIKGFNVEVDATGKNVQHIVDIYNEVGNNFAISSAGIGEAMRRSAASLYASGNTIEESVAMITAANAVIQDPATVGRFCPLM